MPQTQDVILRVDRVGSFRLLLCDEVILSGPKEEQKQSVVNILAPLSNNHARIRRHENGYTLQPLRGSVQLNRKERESGREKLLLEETYWGNNQLAMLCAEIGMSLEIVSPLCQSARLCLTQPHRLADRVDGIVLMDNMILLGPGKMMHIDCPHWEQAGALIYHNGIYRFRLPVGLGGEKQGSPDCNYPTIDEAIQLNHHYSFDEIGFYLES